jgi:hypothetical protein
MAVLQPRLESDFGQDSGVGLRRITGREPT